MWDFLFCLQRRCSEYSYFDLLSFYLTYFGMWYPSSLIHMLDTDIWEYSTVVWVYLGADHSTLEGEGVISGHQEFFFLAIWWAGYFFPFFSHKLSIILICAACNFFLLTSTCRNFFFFKWPPPPPTSKVKWSAPYRHIMSKLK